MAGNPWVQFLTGIVGSLDHFCPTNPGLSPIYPSVSPDQEALKDVLVKGSVGLTFSRILSDFLSRDLAGRMEPNPGRDLAARSTEGLVLPFQESMEVDGFTKKKVVGFPALM